MQARIPHDIQDVPERCWEPTRVVDGVQLWGSREWLVGEVAALRASDAYTKPVMS